MRTLSAPIVVKVKDFSYFPGPARRQDGDASGEAFREDVLEPLIKQALITRSTIVIDRDGTIGYGYAWIEAVFGNLARQYGAETLLNLIHIKSIEEPYLVSDIMYCIKQSV